MEIEARVGGAARLHRPTPDHRGITGGRGTGKGEGTQDVARTWEWLEEDPPPLLSTLRLTAEHASARRRFISKVQAHTCMNARTHTHTHTWGAAGGGGNKPVHHTGEVRNGRQ